MKTLYIERDNEGNINNTSASPQDPTKKPDEQENLPEDNPEVVEYLSKQNEPLSNDQTFDLMMTDKKLKAVVLTLNDAGAFSASDEVLSIPDLKAAIKSNM